MLISDYNRLSEASAVDFAATLVAIPSFTSALVSSRPYPSKRELRDRAADLAAAWDDAEVELALSGHPRIGRAHV